jgi:predicted MFS family arabinose efflux permease
MVPSLVAREDLGNAVALNAAAQNACRVVGPALAGVMIALLGLAATFAVAALLQILALAATWRLPRQISRSSSHPADGASLTLGARLVAQDQFLVNTILLALATNVLVMPYINMMPVFAQDAFGVGSSGLGLLLASTGLGTVAGALWVAHSRRTGISATAQIITAATFAALILAFALTRNVPLAMLLLFAAGVMSAAFLAMAQTAIQLRVDDRVRGRVLSIYLLTWGMLPLGQLAVGAAADRVGPAAAMAGACVLALAAVAIVSRRMRGEEFS